jgi:hypothetical protein
MLCLAWKSYTKLLLTATLTFTSLVQSQIEIKRQGLQFLPSYWDQRPFVGGCLQSNDKFCAINAIMEAIAYPSMSREVGQLQFDSPNDISSAATVYAQYCMEIGYNIAPIRSQTATTPAIITRCVLIRALRSVYPVTQAHVYQSDPYSVRELDFAPP